MQRRLGMHKSWRSSEAHRNDSTPPAHSPAPTRWPSPTRSPSPVRPSSPDQRKIRFERRFKAGGAWRFYGPRIERLPDDVFVDEVDYVDWYLCDDETWQPLPYRHVAIEESRQESYDD
ncbi:hypothetical protein PENSPDRAFT_322231 [Peniophora sp. CONT]|nr:hypothetical protein PENSPDRAFT_322231 [Peniophora sp. CONT]